MKLFVKLVLAFFLCIPMVANAQGNEQVTQKTEETKKLMKKVRQVYKLTSKMEKLSDSISHATNNGDAVFFEQEKEYWDRISADVKAYADSANCAKVKNCYAASSDYWYRMVDCYNQALVNDPAYSLYWNRAMKNAKKIAGIAFDIQKFDNLVVENAKANENAKAKPSDSTTSIDEQPTAKSDVEGFYDRYAAIVEAKKARNESMTNWFYALGLFCALTYIAFFVLIVVRCLRKRKNKKKDKNSVYAPIVEVKYSENVSDSQQNNQANCLSNRLKLADPQHKISHYFEDNTKHFVEQTLTCPIEDCATYKQQLIAYFCKVTGREKCRDKFKDLVIAPLWEKEEGETTVFALPAILDSNVFGNREVFEATTEERTVRYIPWPAFPISEDAADTDNSNPGQKLSVQLSELGKSVDELRTYLSEKRIAEEAETECDVDKEAGIFKNIGNILNLMNTQVDSLQQVLNSSGDDSAAKEQQLQKMTNELETARTQLKEAKQKRLDAVAEVKAQYEKKLAASRQKLADSESLRKEDSVKAQQLLESKLNEAEEQRRQDVAKAEEESKDYRERLTFYIPIQKLAAEVVQILDANYVAENNLDRLGILVKSDLATDDFNYYLNRIRNKYARLMGDYAAKNFSLASELRELALRGLVPTGGVIDGWLKKTKAGLHEATLKQNLYNLLLRPYVSATIIMADECAYLLPKMQPGTVDDKMIRSFADCSKKAKQAAERLGYEVVYAKPLEPMKKFNGVVNDEYASDQAPVNSGDIFEVLSMAVNFGGSVDKTRVSAKK